MIVDNSNVQIVKEALHRFKSGDIATLIETLDDDVIFHTSGPSVIPIAGTFQGHEGAAAFFRRLDQAEEVLAFEPRLYLAEGNTVVVLGHYQARLRASGRTIDFDWAQVFTLRDGRVVRWEQFFDTAAVAEAHRNEALLSR